MTTTPTRIASTGSALVVVAFGLIIWAAFGIADVSRALVVLTFLSAIAFCAVYVRRHWRTPIGYNLMALAAVMVVETGLAILGLAFGANWPGRDYIRAFCWALIAYVLIWRVALLFAVNTGQPRGRQRLDDGREPLPPMGLVDTSGDTPPWPRTHRPQGEAMSTDPVMPATNVVMPTRTADVAASLIRTWVPIGVGAIITWLAASEHVVIPAHASATVGTLVTAAVASGYYTLARLLERAASPAVHRVGNWMLGGVVAPAYLSAAEAARIIRR